jgi:hypothetical protein
VTDEQDHEYSQSDFGAHLRPVSSPPSPPWDDWDLDPKFFSALSQWTIKHPERSLDRVIECICDGVDRGISILELIPDLPFPARGLLGALGHLVKLGAVRAIIYH